MDDDSEEAGVDITDEVLIGLLLAGGDELLPPLPPQAVSNSRSGASDRYLVMRIIRENKTDFTRYHRCNL